MALTHDDVKNLISIIDSAEHLEEIELSWGDFQIHLWRNAGASRSTSANAPAPMPATPSVPSPASDRVAPSPAAPPHAVAPPAAGLDLAPGEVAIRAPMLGTFYRASAPGAEPFVDVGSEVGPDTVVCLIEVMKMMNSVKAGVAGTVVEVCAANAEVVELGEPLFRVEPTS